MRPTNYQAEKAPQLANLLGLLLGLLVLLCTTPAAAIDDPDLDYYTITTPHFYIHYYDGLEGLARRTAIAAEESHQVLSPLLDWEPANRTHVMVIDRLDSANGFARVFGRNFITIFGMPPQADSVLGYYDDWLRVLMYHEYVHILHLDTNPGIPQWVNRIIGKQYHPNSVMPRWYIEGIAVYLESYRTGAGRVQSPLFRMWLRTAALEDSLFTLGQSTGLPIQWPSGSAPYLYGTFFIDHIVRNHDENFIRDFNHRYGGRVLPFALNRTTKDITGRNFDEHWESFTAEALGEARARQVAIKAAGETTLTLLTDGGGRNRYPAIRPGRGGVTFHRADLTTHPVFAALPNSQASPQTIFDGTGSAGPSAWSPDGETLYFSRTTITKNVYSYQDLFAFTPSTGEVNQLTETDRAREPAISPDGRWLTHIRNRAGSMELILRPLDDPGPEQILLGRDDHDPKDDAHWQQISRPIFTADSRGIIFSWWRLDRRQRDLFLVDIESGEIDQLTDSPSHDMDPHLGPDGLLYFTGDVDGIFNIHAMDLDSREIWQVTNVVNGVFSPVVTPDRRWIYVHAYTHKGFEIARFAHPQRFRHADRRPTERQLPRINYPEPRPEGLDNPRPYQPWRWLAPMMFTPDFGVVSGGAGLSGTISGYDPAEHHEYTLSGGWTSGPTLSDSNANIGLRYRYSGGALNTSALLRYQDYPRSQSYFAESRFIPYMERQYLGRLSLSYPIRMLSHRFSIGANYQVEYIDYRARPEVVHEPDDMTPQEPEMGFFNQLSFGVSYSSLFRYPYSISTERGVSASASISLQHPSLGSKENSVTLAYGGDAYHPNPFIDRHVFALQLRGAVTRSSTGPQRLYSIGGHSPQDVLTSVIFQEARRGYPLRGYPPGLLRGGQYQLWKAEYRFPIVDFDRGFSTLPIYIRNLKGSVFSDTGAAYTGFLADAQLHTGIGAEIQLDTVLGYYALNSLRVGFARGLQEDGISEFYLLFGSGY